MSYTAPLNKTIKFGLMSKVLPTSGNLAWEYNPFRNYRLTEAKYYFRNRFFSKQELGEELGDTIEDNLTNWDNYRYPTLENGIHDYEDDPVFYDAGELIDFDTPEFNFDLTHPVDLLPQYSYDGSVNLIINDGKNSPKLINSRFSPIGKNKYQIVDRKGDNDTNIYDQGEQFDTDTSLYKTYVGIPKIEFTNVYNSGNMPIGNYHFYFKYVDADGNETDFVGESGLVSIFRGSSLSSINSGFRDQDSHKSIRFLISNIDSAYQYVNVYYTKATSDIYENMIVEAYKIDQKFLVNNALICNIYITGEEPTTRISIDEINPKYQIAKNVQTQDSCQNMLFFANIEDYSVNYKELADLSLRFTPFPNTDKKYTPVPHNYNVLAKDTYSDPKFIYNFTGYQNHEIYRFGIVYLMENGNLSPVFNIRGLYFTKDNDYSDFKVYDDSNTRNYITYEETTGILYKDNNSTQTTESMENAFGVVRIESKLDSEIHNIIGISITVQDENEVFKELKKLKVKGYFFVRQTRIPLRLCQALTIGIDGESHTPLLYVNKDIKCTNITKPRASVDSSEFYVTERFLSHEQKLTHYLDERLYCIHKSKVNIYGAICPEYDINTPYYNSLFCGNEFLVEQISTNKALIQDVNQKHFYLELEPEDYLNEKVTTVTKIIGVEDNVKVVSIDNKMFSSRAGEAEEAFRYEYITQKIKETQSVNLLRGSYGPYIGFSGYNQPGTLVNIYIKDYKEMSIQDLFKIRINDKSSYFAISERYSITERPTDILYRGDSYICTFTHRFNRNFQDPNAPINSQIVDENCWKDNYEVEDGVVKIENFDKINLGDVNAVEMGMWVTFSLISSNNLNIRAIDEHNTDEVALTGHPRAFFPYSGISTDGSYKIPEALCFNKGFNKSVSERYNFEVPDVPAIKNDFTNRIAYSDIHVNDAFKNGFRTFQQQHYRDYPKTYGQITKIIELSGNLLVVFEHGIGLIGVNERAVAAEGAQGLAYINTSNVLPENPKIISDKFGSQWKDSIIKTPGGVYGVDTIAKKIWKTDGNSFEAISDFKIQEFLNNNISLSERELTPIIGIRNVKTHYNAYKHDVLFTFYDNLYGFEERVWNICWNELQQKWITFYSWLPSYSENIYNQYFSFDRNTSKWISKLGISNSNNNSSDGVCISNNIIDTNAQQPSNIKFPGSVLISDIDCPDNMKYVYPVGELTLENRNLPTGDDIKVDISFEIVRDNYQNYKYFGIFKEYESNSVNNPKYYLYLKVDAFKLCSELFVRGIKEGNNYIAKITDPTNQNQEWVRQCLQTNNYCIVKDDRGRRVTLDKKLNASNIVRLLNIKANINVTYNGTISNITEAYSNSFTNGVSVNAGYYQSVVAVIPKWNMQFLTTDFWKHGQSGIIDIADKIYPTYWYDKQHPFEFEFIVAENPNLHKIFDNLQIISNNAEPESFHYEIVGDVYDFSNDKKNMYIRQEATKELYQYNGCDILFDRNYHNLNEVHRQLDNGLYDKSTILPLYYSRQDTINEIEDYYHLKDNIPTKDFSALSGAEIVRYEKLDEYRIWNHTKAIDQKLNKRLRGNMEYKENLWNIQINPINLAQCNEPQWQNGKIPIEITQAPIPNEVLQLGHIDIPQNINNSIVSWKAKQSEVKLKDNFIKIRIRYSGKKLAVISAIRTLYSVSYA